MIFFYYRSRKCQNSQGNGIFSHIVQTNPLEEGLNCDDIVDNKLLNNIDNHVVTPSMARVSLVPNNVPSQLQN